MSISRSSLIAAALALAGCGGGNEGGTGTLSLAITDAPVDNATDVVVEVTGIDLHGPDGTRSIELEAPRQFHLLALTSGASGALLDQVELAAGRYEWIRLKVDTTDISHSYVETTTGATYPIRIPSNAQTGLKLNRGFVVPVGGSASFTIDFDLRKSLVDTNGTSYTLKPVLRIVDNAEVGALAGTVNLTSYGCDDSGNAVYLYAGHGITPTDIDTTANAGPLTVAPVLAPDSNLADYHYRAAFLPAGNYTVALTCDAELDRAEGADTLSFKAAYDVIVTSGAVAAQAFPSIP